MIGGGGRVRAAMGRGPMGPGMGMPTERGKDLRGTARRLLARLRPERIQLVSAVGLGVVSVGFIVTGPKILGNATNILFDGIVGQRLPAGDDAGAGRRRCCAPTARASWRTCCPG